MTKYVIKNCPNLTKSYYSTGEVVHNQCGLTDDNLCQDCTDCVMKQIAENLNLVTYQCTNCDGCGYYEDCKDVECGTYQALKSLELLDIQEVE